MRVQRPHSGSLLPPQPLTSLRLFSFHLFFLVFSTLPFQFFFEVGDFCKSFQPFPFLSKSAANSMVGNTSVLRVEVHRSCYYRKTNYKTNHVNVPTDTFHPSVIRITYYVPLKISCTTEIVCSCNLHTIVLRCRMCAPCCLGNKEQSVHPFCSPPGTTLSSVLERK